MSSSSIKLNQLYQNIPGESSEGYRNISTPDTFPEVRKAQSMSSTSMGHDSQRRRSRSSQELCELTSLSSSSSLERGPQLKPALVSPVLDENVLKLPPKPLGPPKLPPILSTRSHSDSKLPGRSNSERNVKKPGSRSVYINYPTLPPKRKERVVQVGGFECEFVEMPPKEIEQKCPICLQVIREPHQVDCCGYSFCKTCIYRVKVSKKPCPMCNNADFSVYPNKGLKRVLYDLQVFCSHAGEGCSWTGELRQLVSHLRGDYYDNELVNGCQYTELQCLFCFHILKRNQLQDHVRKVCKKRPYTCTHCNEYASTFEDVTENHIIACPNIAVLCPYDCGVLVARRDVDVHARSCGKTEVNCDFEEFGCEMKVLRMYLQDHVVQSTSEHLVLVANSHRELKREVEQRDSLIEELREIISVQKSEINSLKLMQNTLKRSLSQLRNLVATLPIRVSVNNFSKLRAKNGVWLSQPFYTHPRGYKMCLQTHVRPNDPGKPGFSMSVYLFLMQGEFDEVLSFPLVGTVTVQLLSHSPRAESVRRDIVFHQYMSVLCNSRVTRGEIASEGWGFVVGFSEDKRLAVYKLNDSLTFEIMSVQLA